ncbi:MAG TPA: hypothetical protein VHW71_07565 [Steroidobacteraceae bacterium]|nr:hypothetical protein [Steroidobacteraceae bacterium]
MAWAALAAAEMAARERALGQAAEMAAPARAQVVQMVVLTAVLMEVQAEPVMAVAKTATR